MENEIRKKMYIKLYYSLLDWEWYSEPNTFRVFLHLLLTANRKDKPYKGDVIRRGEALASLEYISQQTGLSIQSTRTALKNLQSTGEITKRKIGKTCVFACVNFSKWQGDNIVSTDNQQFTDNNATKYKQQANKSSTTPIYCNNEENDKLLYCEKKPYARTNKKGVITDEKRAPSYNLEEAVKNSLRLDPNKTKRTDCSENEKRHGAGSLRVIE